MREHPEYAKDQSVVDEATHDDGSAYAGGNRAPSKKRRLDSVDKSIRLLGLLPFWNAVDEWLKLLISKWTESTSHPEWQK